MTLSVADPRLLADDLAAVLDELAGLEERTLGHLRALATVATDRAAGEADGLLAEAGETHARFQEADARRQSIGRCLATALGRAPADLPLSRLARLLGGPQGRALDDRRRRLEALAADVRRCHLRTAVLLWEAARVNRSLLAGLFPQADTARTYGAGGRPRHGAGGGLLDTRS